jgi:hypothetical protein
MRVKSAIVFSTAFLGFVMLTFAGIKIAGSLTQEREAQAGETYQGVILIKNTGKEAQEAKLSQTDYFFSFDGKNSYGEPGKSPRSNAAWITFNPPRLTIPADSAFEVHYTVKVPEDRALCGTYWSMLMVEETSEASPDLSRGGKNRPQVGLKTVFRYGIQMVTHIGNSGICKLKFLKTELLKESGKIILQMDIENAGERWLRPSLYAELYNEKGKYVGRFKSGQFRVYPATSVRMKIDLSGLPKGIYKTMIIADNGDENVFAAQYVLTL